MGSSFAWTLWLPLLATAQAAPGGPAPVARLTAPLALSYLDATGRSGSPGMGSGRTEREFSEVDGSGHPHVSFRSAL